jgi:hypothetical protein
MEMERILLRMNEQEKYEIIKSCSDGKINKYAASIKLGKSIRQINRLLLEYKKRGKATFIHGNRSRTPVNKMSNTLSNKIIQLCKEDYKGENENYLMCNFSHLRDLLFERNNIKISYASLYSLLFKNEIYTPKIHRITRKKIVRNKIRKEKPLLANPDVEILVNHKINIEDAHPRQERSKYFGELLQMDACSKIWGSSFFATLHLAIDNATGRIVGGYFCEQETLLGYFNIFRQILMNFGIPNKFKTDRRTVFTYKQKRSKDETKNALTQFGYSCKILGCLLETTSVPQSKGQIERANGTIQDRLSVELKLNLITNIEDANTYLINSFIPKFNQKFGSKLEGFKSVFVEVDKTKIDFYLSTIAKRRFDKGSAIKYKNQYYQAFKDDTLVCFLEDTKCLVINAFDGEKFVSVDDQIYELKKLNKNKLDSLMFDQITPTIAKRSKWIPPLNHPWRYENYDNFQDAFKKNYCVN